MYYRSGVIIARKLAARRCAANIALYRRQYLPNMAQRGMHENNQGSRRESKPKRCVLVNDESGALIELGAHSNNRITT